jgi:hypothetical protein
VGEPPVVPRREGRQKTAWALLRGPRDWSMDEDTLMKQMRVTQPEVRMQLPGPNLCQAVCGSRRQANENTTWPLSFGRARSGKGSWHRLVNKSLQMQGGKLADMIKLLNEGS